MGLYAIGFKNGCEQWMLFICAYNLCCKMVSLFVDVFYS